MRYALPIVALLALAPLFLPGFQVKLLTEVLIFALLAMSLNLQIGYARMFSFGHAASYGIGAYVCAFALQSGNFSFPVAVLIATGAVFIYAIPIGWLCTRVGGVAFSMLTLAFAQLVYAIVYKWNGVTGGSDGIAGLVRNPGPFGLPALESNASFYLFTLAVVVGLALLAVGFVRSPMGTAIVAVRENENRAIAIGYEPRKLRLAAFVASNTIGGVAGALHSGFLLFVSPEILHWMLSGHIIIAVMLGGAGSIVGPMLGAAFIIIAGHELSAVTDSWPLVMGLLFIAVVVVAPKGLWGIKDSILGTFAARKAQRLGVNRAAS